GVYAYGGAPQFPSQSYLNANYWVDVDLSVTSGTTSSAGMWSTSSAPGTPSYNDPNPVTLGVKFRSDISGSVTGVRFYKAGGNTGTHIGLLYNNSGTLLAQATFTGETASGWQQVNFSVPVSVAPNTTYIAAYFTTTGFAL